MRNGEFNMSPNGSVSRMFLQKLSRKEEDERLPTTASCKENIGLWFEMGK